MKTFTQKRLFVIFGLFTICLMFLISACSHSPTPVTPSNSPTSTPTNVPTSVPFTPTPTTTTTVSTTGIYWTQAFMDTTGDNTSDKLSSISLYLLVNGAAETTAAVTLTTPEGNVTIPSTGTTTLNTPGGTYTYATFSSDLSSLNRTYDAGSSYTLTTVTSIGTAYSTVTGPGGNINLASDGSSATWTTNGNLSSALAQYLSGGTYGSGTGITTPYSFPGSAFPGAGQYSITLSMKAQGLITGATTAAQFIIWDQHTYSVTR